MEPVTSIALGSIAAISGIIYTWAKIIKIVRKQRDLRDASILQAAKEADQLLKTKLEAKIVELDTKVKTLEVSINKDISHLKETYSEQIKVLGEKVDQLRDELRDQHSQMVTLLSKLIDAK